MQDSNHAPVATSVYVGHDLHKGSIAIFRDWFLNRRVNDQRLAFDMRKVRRCKQRIRQRFGELRCCYEASSCGFALCRFLRGLDVHGDVIAPLSIPRRSGDWTRTDRRDTQKLATMYQVGLLTAIAVPDEELEATRGLLRCRSALVEGLPREAAPDAVSVGTWL